VSQSQGKGTHLKSAVMVVLHAIIGISHLDRLTSHLL